MSYYATCNIEFKKEYTADLLPLIKEMGDCFVVGYTTDETVIAQFNGRRYDSSSDWQTLVGKARDLEEERDEEIFHIMTYDEYSIEEGGTFYDGEAYIDLCVAHYNVRYDSFQTFINNLEALE